MPKTKLNVVEKPGYETDDGKIFHTMKAAKSHAAYLELSEVFSKTAIYDKLDRTDFFDLLDDNCAIVIAYCKGKQGK